MALSFLVFALLTYDFVRVLHANAGYLSSYGLMGLLDGGLVQLLGLLLTGLGAMGPGWSTRFAKRCWWAPSFQSSCAQRP